MTPCLRSPEMETLDQEIEAAKAALHDLYAKKKELKARAKAAIPHKPTAKERKQQVYDLAVQGKTLREIASEIGLTYPTVRHYLWSALWSEADSQLGDDEPYNFEKRSEIMRALNAKLPHGLSKRTVL